MFFKFNSTKKCFKELKTFFKIGDLKRTDFEGLVSVLKVTALHLVQRSLFQAIIFSQSILIKF